MIRSVVVFVLVILSFNAAYGQNALLETLNVKKNQNWRIGLSATHLDGFGDTRVEPGSTFGISVDHTIKKSLHLDASLRVNKLYYVDFESDDEFRLSDAYIGLRHILKKDTIKGAVPMISYGVLLPTSAYSIRQDVLARLYLGGSASWSFLKDTLIMSASLDGLVNVNRYTTTKTGQQSAGGGLLPLYGGTAGLSFTYLLGNRLKFKNRFLKSILLSASTSYGRTYFEDFSVSPVENTEFRLKDDTFSSGVSVIASPYKSWFLSLGYGHNAEVESLGRTDYYLFDPSATRWRVGLRHTRRF